MKKFYVICNRELIVTFSLMMQICIIFMFSNVPAIASAKDQFANFSTFKDCGECSEMIALPAGTYLMGATDDEFKGFVSKFRYMYVNETPRHQVTVKSFSLAKFDVTRMQFKIFADETGFQGKGCRVLKGNSFVNDPSADWKNPGFKQTDQDPVVCVSWSDAHKFIDWLNLKISKTRSVKYRLPTEAEWEYAARAGTVTATYWGGDRRQQCEHENALDLSSKILNVDVIDRDNPFADCTDGFVETSPVGTFRPNPWGFFDMLGDVYQWMEDCPEIGYIHPPATPPRSNTMFCRSEAALRGASWISVPIKVRAAFRSGAPLDFRENTIGFRYAADQTN